MSSFKASFKKLTKSIRDEVDGLMSSGSGGSGNGPSTGFAPPPTPAPAAHHNHYHNPHHHHRPRKVFAHYMVGLTNNQAAAQWQKDVAEAQAAGIDGFALNIGSDDPWTEEQLDMAYETAAAVGGQGAGFVMFLSFDMAASSWTVEHVVALVRRYAASPAQFRVQGHGHAHADGMPEGLPFVSTFEGPDWGADNWARVRAETGGLFLVPDWASLGPHGVGEKLDVIDGAWITHLVNWGAWPGANQKFMSTREDSLYRQALRGKAYMMGVSPYFYTNLPQWNKNWYSSSDSLWYDRWKQIIQMQPEYVQIITWNDYGESSYINDPVRAQVVQGAEKYVQAFPHSAFRFVLPYFIAAYKAGHTNVPLPAEGAVAWYRTCPSSATGHCETVWGQCGSHPASAGTEDVISIITLSFTPPPLVQVSVGEWSQVASPLDHFGAATFYQVPFHGRFGFVTLAVNGRAVTGPDILHADSCHPDHVHLNAVAIQL